MNKMTNKQNRNRFIDTDSCQRGGELMDWVRKKLMGSSRKTKPNKQKNLLATNNGGRGGQ